MNLVEREENLPKTQTELTKDSICLCITWYKEQKIKERLKKINLDDSSIKNVILLLGKFAYEMIEKNQFVFNEEEISKAKLKICKDHNVLGLLPSVQFNETVGELPKRVYNFVHFSFQEYLAAYYLSTCYCIKQCGEIKKFGNQDILEFCECTLV